MDPITLWFIAISFVISIYVNFIRSYWSRRGIPTPSAFDIHRFSLPIHIHDQEIYTKYGTIVGLYEGLRPTLMIGDPKLIRDILVKDFPNFPNHRAFNFGHTATRLGFFYLRGSEERWERLRSVISSSFTTGKMRMLTPKVNECITNLLNNLAKVAEAGEPVDMRKYFRGFSLDVIASTAFGITIDSMNEPDNPIVSNAKKFFSRKPVTRLFFEIYLTFARLKQMRPTDFESINYFAKLTEKITREKRHSRKRKYSGGLINGKKLDFIQMVLDVIDHGVDPLPDSIEEERSDGQTLRSEPDNVTHYGHEEETVKKDFNNNGGNKRISLDELTAQGILFFLAGYDTTASLLSNIAYLLAANPEAQERLILEIDSWNSQFELNYDTVNQFKFLDAIVWETLRLFPPVSRVERECVADYKLRNTGIYVPAGMTVSIPVYAIHRDPKNFPDPNSFKPERFLVENDKAQPQLNRHPYSFLPFGGGPRNCLGIRLALIEAKMCLVQVLKRFRFKVSSSAGEIEHYSDQVLISPKQVLLSLEERREVKVKIPLKRRQTYKKLIRQFTW